MLLHESHRELEQQRSSLQAQLDKVLSALGLQGGTSGSNGDRTGGDAAGSAAPAADARRTREDEPTPTALSFDAATAPVASIRPAAFVADSRVAIPADSRHALLAGGRTPAAVTPDARTSPFIQSRSPSNASISRHSASRVSMPDDDQELETSLNKRPYVSPNSSAPSSPAASRSGSDTVCGSHAAAKMTTYFFLSYHTGVLLASVVARLRGGTPSGVLLAEAGADRKRHRYVLRVLLFVFKQSKKPQNVSCVADPFVNIHSHRLLVLVL